MTNESTLWSLWGQMLLVCTLLLMACGGRMEPQPLAASFGQASDAQIEQALYSFMRPVDYGEHEYWTALGDSDASGGVCPRVEREGERTIILAEGCVAPSGNTYAGRLEHIEAEAPDYEIRFEAYRRITPEGDAYTYDGTILADVSGTDEGVFRSALILERPEVTLDIDVTANCRPKSEDGGETFQCTFAPGSRVAVGDLGRFIIEGSFSHAPGVDPAGMLVYRGTDVMRVDILPRWCMRYTIEGSEPRIVCPNGD